MDYFIELFKLIIVLSVFVGAMYLLLKKMKKGRFNKVSTNRMIQVIDGVQIGMKEEIVLLKVGKEYFIMSLNSGYMTPLKQEEIHIPEEQFDDLFARENPTLALKGLVKTLKDGVKK